MKKLFISLIILSVILCYSTGFAQRHMPPPGGRTIIEEIDGSPTGVPWKIKVSNTALTDNGDGTFTLITGAGGGGDVSGGAASAAGEIAVYDGVTGKLIKQSGLGAGIVKLSAAAVASIATAGVDYVVPAAIGVTVQAYDADLDYLSTFTPTANVKTILNAANNAAIMTALGLTANAQSLVTAADYAAMKVLLALTIGTNVQAWDADLDTWAGVTSTANARSLVSAADYAAMKALLDLEVGTDFPPINNAILTGTLTVPAIQLNNSGLRIYDTGASHSLTLTLGSDLTDNRIFTLTTGDAARTLTMSADATINANTTALSVPGNWKVFYTNGTGVQTEVALDVAGTVLMSNGVAAAPTMQAPSGAGDVTSQGDCLSGACGDGTSDGGSYIELYAAAGNTRLVDTAGVLEVKTAAGAAYAPLKVAALTATGTTTIDTGLTGILKATAGVVAAATAGSDYPGLAAANTWTGNNVFGDADTDTLTLRSILAGGNSRAVQITDTLATPTYATGPTELYVKGRIQSDTGIYAPFYDSVLAPGNVGWTRIREDPTHGTNFRAFSVLGTNYLEDLTFTFPLGVNAANDIFILGAPSGNVSPMSYSGLASLMNSVFGTTQGSLIYHNGTTWVPLSYGTNGYFLKTQGVGANPVWAGVTAAAAGAEGNLQYNAAGVLAAESTLSYNSTTNTLGIIQNGTDPSITTGDGTYTWLYTPQVGIEGTLEVQSGASVATFLRIPNAASPTVDAAGKIAVRSGAGAAGGLAIYSNAAPGSVMLPVYIPWSPTTVKDPVSTSDYFYGFSPYAITIRSVHYLCEGGTSWTGQLQICDANGASCADTQAANTTAAAGTTTNVTSFSDATVPSGVWMRFNTASVSGSPTSITVQMDYSVD